MPVLGEEDGLDAEFDAHRKGSDGDADVGADAGRHRAPRRQDGRARGKQTVRPVADEGQDDAHIQAVGEDRQNPAVAEEERLENQRRADRDHRRPRPQDDRDQRSADAVRRRPSWNRDVEHHDREAKGREDRQERHGPVVQDLLDPLRRQTPDRHRRDRQGQ